MARVSIYLFDDRVFVQAQAKTESGFHFSAGPITVVHVDAEAIGVAVVQALQSYRAEPRTLGVSHEEQLHVAAGLDGWDEFERRAKYVSVSQQNEQIKVRPWRNAGPRWGRVAVDGRERVVAADSRQLGVTILAALDDAE